MGQMDDLPAANGQLIVKVTPPLLPREDTAKRQSVGNSAAQSYRGYGGLRYASQLPNVSLHYP